MTDSTKRFNPPPNWPAPPEGWTPPEGWQPDPAWGPPPQGWQVWVDDSESTVQPESYGITAASDGSTDDAGQGAKAARPFFRKKRFLLPAGLVAVIVAASLGGGGDDQAPVSQVAAADAGAESAAAGEEAAENEAAENEAAEKEAAEKEAAEKEAAEKEAAEKEAAEKEAAEKEAAIGVGTPVRDGKFEFTVTGVEKVGTTIGDDFFEEEAQGEFVIVRVDVTNIGDQAQMLSAGDQILRNDKGQEFATSSDGMFSLDGYDKVFLEDINPGNSVTDAPLLFDVPAGTVLDSIELHDSLFSGGVEVSLKDA